MKCIFAYSEFPTFGSIDDYDGFKIEIVDNGTIHYNTINIDNEVGFRKEYKVSELLVNNIQNLVIKNKKVFKFYDDLDTNTLDGYGHEFYFSSNKGNKKIVAWNIDVAKEIKLINIIPLLLMSLFNKDIKELCKNIRQEQFL